MIYAKGTFLWWRLCISSFRTIAYIVNKQSGICKEFLLLRGLCVPSVKTTTYVYNRFEMKKKIFFFSNLNEKFWIKWKAFYALVFTPYSNETTSLKTIPSFEFTHISWFLYIWLLWKKVYVKLFLNRFMLIQLTFTCSKPVTLFWCFYC